APSATTAAIAFIDVTLLAMTTSVAPTTPGVTHVPRHQLSPMSRDEAVRKSVRSAHTSPGAGLLTTARYARAISRIVVIGATGHVGSYLVPRLVRGGH